MSGNPTQNIATKLNILSEKINTLQTTSEDNNGKLGKLSDKITSIKTKVKTILDNIDGLKNIKNNLQKITGDEVVEQKLTEIIESLNTQINSLTINTDELETDLSQIETDLDTITSKLPKEKQAGGKKRRTRKGGWIWWKKGKKTQRKNYKKKKGLFKFLKTKTRRTKIKSNNITRTY